MLEMLPNTMRHIVIGVTRYEEGRPETLQEHRSRRVKYFKLERTNRPGKPVAVCKGWFSS